MKHVVGESHRNIQTTNSKHSDIYCPNICIPPMFSVSQINPPPQQKQRLTKGHPQNLGLRGSGPTLPHVSRWLDSCKESIFDKHPWGWFHGCYVVCHSTLDFKRDMVDEELCWNCMGVRFWKSLWKIWGPRHFFDGQTGSFEKSYNQVNHTGIIHRNHPRSLECIANLSLPCGGVRCFLVGLPFSKSLPLAKDETAARDERRRLGWWKWWSDAPRASNGRFIGIHD